MESLRGRHFLRVADWTGEELAALLALAGRLKRERAAGEEHPLLPGRTLGLVFQKPSTRTRVSFEVGIHELGGLGIVLPTSDLQLGRGEPLRDTALVLSRYLDGIVIRTFAQEDVEKLAEHGSIPVVNGLTDDHHPCQALADAQTIGERLGRLEGVRVAWVGDGNNVLRSFAEAAALTGMRLTAAIPEGYEGGIPVEVVRDPREAVRGADVVYTDVWTSMGREAERERRLRDFEGFTVDESLLGLAAPDAFVLHCLPAHAGEEISAGVLYGERSAVWDQAENRLHAQKALLALIMV